MTASTPVSAVSASAPLPAATASTVAEAPAPLAPQPAKPAVIPVAATSTIDPIAARLAAGRETLAGGAQLFAVQLMVTDARERAYLGNYLADAAQSLPTAKLFIAEAGSPETPRYGVLYGPFHAKAEAIEALNALPAGLRQFGPYVRTVDSLRDDARRASRR